ncbi:MAG: hypothetical protein GYB66_11420 [Chloroflexi bacterium]|nr:hypothetical protein [Chloroflexota bacterium]
MGQGKPQGRRLVFGFWGISLLSIVWTILLALDLVPVLRGDYGWRWPYAKPDAPERLLPLVGVASLTLLWGLSTFRRQSTLWLLAGAFVATPMISLASIYVVEPDVHFELYARTISPGATGWHYAATDIDDLQSTLERWPEFMDSYEDASSHMTTSPPGLPLAYYAAIETLGDHDWLSDEIAPGLRADQCHNDRVVGWSLYEGYSDAELTAAWLGMLMPLWAGFVVFPLYWLGVRLFSETAARAAALWWPLVPSTAMFAPNPTPLYALLGLVTIGLLYEGLRRNQRLWLVGSGMAMSVATFMHFTPAPIIFLAGVYTLGYYWRHRTERSLSVVWPVKQGLWFGLGLVTIWLVYFGVSGVTPFSILQQSFESHLALKRPYVPWLWLHLNDFFMFTGWGLALLALAGVWRTSLRFCQPEQLGDGDVLVISATITLIVMDISGTTQGESGRIWLFMSPFVLLAAAAYVAGRPNIGARDLYSTTSITLSQVIILVVMVGFLRVMGSGLHKPPEKPPSLSNAPQTEVLAANAVFGDVLVLESFAGHIVPAPGEDQPTLALWLNWRSTGQLDAPYYLAFLPVAPDGQAVPPAVVVQPFDGDYPVTCWLPGSGAIKDKYEIPLSVADVEGDWWVSLALVNGRTGEQLTVVDALGNEDTQVGIGPIRLRAQEDLLLR